MVQGSKADEGTLERKNILIEAGCKFVVKQGGTAELELTASSSL